MIRVEHLKKIFLMGTVSVHALRDVSFDIAEGEFVGIMGASGSGKSTLMRQLGLIDEPTSGDIFLDDQPTRELTAKERSRFRLHEFGYIFQEYALIPELTAIENVMLPGMMKGGSMQEYTSRAEELLKTVGLEHRVHHRPRELSGGEQQRVAIARSLINSPRVLFADEPTANLDSQSSKNVMETFRQLNTEMKQTIIMVTHEQEHTVYFKRILLMKDGKLVEKRKQHE